MRRKVHLVLSAGGMRTLAYVGALQALEEAGIEVASVSGVSAGAVVGALIADGMTGDELAELIRSPEGDVSNFAGRQPSWFARFWALRKWPFTPSADHDFAEFVVKTLGADKTFGELARPFATMGVDIIAGDYLVYGPKTHPDMRVSEAVSIATALPMFAHPYQKGNRVVVDAAISTKSPVWLTAAVEDAESKHLPIVVLRPTPMLAVREPSNLNGFARLLINATASGRDRLFLRGNPRVHVIDLPTTAVKPYEFDLDAEARTRLIDIGRRETAIEVDKVDGDFASVQPRLSAAIAHLSDGGSTNHDPNDEETAAWAGAHFAQRFESSAPEVFISYAREDAVWLAALLSHLARYTNVRGAFSTWTDAAIEPGDTWSEEIRDAIARARAAVLLVSTSFKNSEFIEKHEIPQLLQATEERCIPVMLLFVEQVDLRWMNIQKFQGLNQPDRPLAEVSDDDLDDELKRIAEAVADSTAMA